MLGAVRARDGETRTAREFQQAVEFVWGRAGCRQPVACFIGAPVYLTVRRVGGFAGAITGFELQVAAPIGISSV